MELSERMDENSHLSGASWLVFPSVGGLVFHYRAVQLLPPMYPIVLGVCSSETNDQVGVGYPRCTYLGPTVVEMVTHEH